MLPTDEIHRIQDSGAGPAPRTQIAFAPQLRLLVLAPHPDDFDAAAVTMSHFLKNGNHISVAVLTSGAGGVEDSFVIAPTEENKIVLREHEQEASLRFFGLPRANLSFLRLPAGQDDSTQLMWRHAVKEFISEAAPDIVLLPYGEDTNASHRRTYLVFRDIAAGTANPLLALYLQDPKTIRIRLDFYVPFSDEQARWKSRMLQFHQSQQARNLSRRGQGLDERILQINRQIASKLEGVPYAEGFQVELFHPEIGSCRTKP